MYQVRTGLITSIHWQRKNQIKKFTQGHPRSQRQRHVKAIRRGSSHPNETEVLLPVQKYLAPEIWGSEC